MKIKVKFKDDKVKEIVVEETDTIEKIQNYFGLDENIEIAFKGNKVNHDRRTIKEIGIQTSLPVFVECNMPPFPDIETLFKNRNYGKTFTHELKAFPIKMFSLLSGESDLWSFFNIFDKSKPRLEQDLKNFLDPSVAPPIDYTFTKFLYNFGISNISRTDLSYYEIENEVEKMNNTKKYFQLFLSKIKKEKKSSLFEYRISRLGMLYKDSRKYEKNKNKIKDVQTTMLLHGTSLNAASAILSEKFKPSSGKLGLGTYFLDSLDCLYCFSCRTQSVPKIGDSFFIVASEVYFDKDKIKVVEDDKFAIFERHPEEEFHKFKGKCAEKGGVNYGLSEGIFSPVVLKASDTTICKNKFFKKEYLVSYNEQINPIFGVTLERAEYCVIWRDPNLRVKNAFASNNEELKKFIEENLNYNLYIATSTQEGLTLVDKKKYNKIILMSNIGQDLSGKDFIEKARKILGFNAIVLFSALDLSHLKWLKTFPNALFSSKAEFTREYLLNFNKEGLEELKKKIETFYKCKFMDFKDAFDYPYFVNSGEIDELDCEAMNTSF